MTIGRYLENVIINHLLRNQSFNSPNKIYVSLHSADPGQIGKNELVERPYTRQPIVFSPSTDGTTSNEKEIEFFDMPASNITHMGLWDDVQKGHFLWGGALASPKRLGVGDALRILAHDLEISID